jgi:hypothetical protein
MVNDIGENFKVVDRFTKCFRSYLVSLMKNWKYSLKKAGFSIFAGFIISVISSQLWTRSNYTNLVGGIFHVGAIIGVIETIENRDYSGVFYASGYFVGVVFFGKLFPTLLDTGFILIILFLYLLGKFSDRF